MVVRETGHGRVQEVPAKTPVNNAAVNIEQRKGANWVKWGQIYVSGGKLDLVVVEHTIEYANIKL